MNIIDMIVALEKYRIKHGEDVDVVLWEDGRIVQPSFEEDSDPQVLTL